MHRRRLVLAAALLGAVFVSAGLTFRVAPFQAAKAEPPAQANAAAQAALDRLLEQSQPGARVTRRPDGGFAAQGTRTPEAAAVYIEMEEVRKAGPATVACTGGGARVTCTALASFDAADRLTRGQTLYGRSVHGGITADMIGRGAPMFGPDELICGTFDQAGTASCATALSRRPELASGQTAIATYVAVKAGHVQAPRPTIAAARRSD
jgi:hypothetical protein